MQKVEIKTLKDLHAFVREQLNRMDYDILYYIETRQWSGDPRDYYEIMLTFYDKNHDDRHFALYQKFYENTRKEGLHLKPCKNDVVLFCQTLKKCVDNTLKTGKIKVECKELLL